MSSPLNFTHGYQIIEKFKALGEDEVVTLKLIFRSVGVDCVNMCRVLVDTTMDLRYL
jgi:hypothetical protein